MGGLWSLKRQSGRREPWLSSSSGMALLPEQMPGLWAEARQPLALRGALSLEGPSWRAQLYPCYIWTGPAGQSCSPCAGPTAKHIHSRGRRSPSRPPLPRQ